MITFGARNFLQDVDIAGVQVAAGFECDVAARHLGQVGEQILQAFSAVAPVGDGGFGVNDDESCQREGCDGLDEVVPAVGAAAVPMDLFLRGQAERFHCFADVRASSSSHNAAAIRYVSGSRSGCDPLSSPQAVSMSKKSRESLQHRSPESGQVPAEGDLCATCPGRWCGVVR